MYDPKSIGMRGYSSVMRKSRKRCGRHVRGRGDRAHREILDKAAGFHGLTHREAAVLLEVDDPETAGGDISRWRAQVKEHIYGRRIVLFAPLYLSDYCVNHCTYCGYSSDHRMTPAQADAGGGGRRGARAGKHGAQATGTGNGRGSGQLPHRLRAGMHQHHLLAQIREWRHSPGQRQHRRHHGGELSQVEGCRHRHLHPLPGNLSPSPPMRRYTPPARSTTTPGTPRRTTGRWLPASTMSGWACSTDYTSGSTIPSVC